MASVDGSPQGKLRTRQIVECVIWLALAVGMWGYSYAFDRELSTFALGPIAWPRAIIVMIAIVALCSLLSDLRLSAGPPVVSGVESGGEDQALDGQSRLRLLHTLLLPLLYVWLLPLSGYFATTPVFLAAYMWILGIKSWRVIVITTVVAYVLLLLIFSKLLYIPLPTGNWPGFYDFSNWLLVWLGK